MPTLIRRAARPPLLALAMLSALASLPSCSFDDQGCETSDDCRDGRVCAQSLCLAPGELPPAPDMSLNPDQRDMTPGPQDMPPPAPDAGQDQPGPIDQPGDSDMAPTPDMPSPQDMPQDQPDTPADMPPAPDGDMTPDVAPDLPPVSVIGPRMRVVPAGELSFGNNPLSATIDAPVLIENTGDAPLTITRLELNATPSQGFQVSPSVGSSGAALRVIAPGQALQATATFSPTVVGNYQNAVVIEGDDPNNSQAQVRLRGTAFQAISQVCLYSSPDVLDFGVVAPGSSRTMTVLAGSCSSGAPVTLTQLSLATPSPALTLSTARPLPITLSPGQTTPIAVTFAPTSPDDVSTQLRLGSSSQVSNPSIVELVASGGGCPQAIAWGADASTSEAPGPGPVVFTAPGEVVLDGTQSVTASGQTTYQWSSTGGTLMGAGLGITTLSVAQPGRYRATLTVTDATSGLSACEVSELDLYALSGPAGIEATVSWSADHDVDLHILRSDAMGDWPSWADMGDDLHYRNPTPDWGAPNSAVDDGLFFGDVTRGPGAERAMVLALEPGRRYRVAAQFSRANGLQPLQFTVTGEVRVGGMTRTLTHTFNRTEQGVKWLMFDIDGATGVISTVDATQR